MESEVFALLHDLGERQELLHASGIRVSPRQFLGIEIKPWAKEIAELVLWIGYLQWHFRTHGRVIPTPEPVLQDYQNIECRDAVLAYDREELVRDEKGKPVTRWDGETMKKHSVTGEMVPDERSTVSLFQYINPTQATWPNTDFVVGNPPFMGNWRMRAELGDGYAETLRAVYKEVPESAEFVMYWWHRAATFPFPYAKKRLEERIRSLAEELDAHRKRQQALHPKLTLTKLYKALEAVRSGGNLDEADQQVWQDGLGSTLLSLHDDLDVAVFEAYGWPSNLTDEQILEKLVALNAERAAEEACGLVRWLRPEFQNPKGARPATQTTIAAVEEPEEDTPTAIAPEAKTWPKKLPEQIAAIRDRLGVMRGLFTVDAVAAGLKGAKKKDLADLLDGLAALGVVVAIDDENGRRWRNARQSVDA